MPTVIIEPSGRRFLCEGRQSILEAALAASIALSYGCSSGTCGLCVGRLKRGDIEKVSHYDYPIKDADRQRGDFLLCAYTAASPEIVVEAAEAEGSADIPWQRIEARLRKLERLSDDIAELAVQTPRTSRLRFLPGQNVCLTLTDGSASDLPIASCPCDDRNIAFHLRNDPSDRFAAAVFATSRFPVPMRIEGPWGAVPEACSSEMTVCIAYDTFIAPLRSWIEQQLTDDATQSIHLYWYVRDASDFYLKNLLKAWGDAFESFDSHLVVVGDPAGIRQALADGPPKEIGAAGHRCRLLLAGPSWFTEQVTGELARLRFPTSDQYVHSVARAG